MHDEAVINRLLTVAVNVLTSTFAVYMYFFYCIES